MTPRALAFALLAWVTTAGLSGATSCKPNEEIVCATRNENTGPSCAAGYDLCAGGTDRTSASRPAPA